MVSGTGGSEPAATRDGFQQMMRLPPMADGERPAALSGERFRLRESDGSQPRSRMETSDGVRPAAMVTDGERPAVTSDESRLGASDGSQPQSRRKATDGERPAAMVDATMNDGSLLQQSRMYATTETQCFVYPHPIIREKLNAQLIAFHHAMMNDGSLLQQSQDYTLTQLLVYPHLKRVTTNDGSLLQ